MPRGILGMKKDTKHQLLFMFRVPQGEEWPSSDSDDSDYAPDDKEPDDFDTDNSSESDQSINLKKVRKRSKLTKIEEGRKSLGKDSKDTSRQSVSASKKRNFEHAFGLSDQKAVLENTSRKVSRSNDCTGSATLQGHKKYTNQTSSQRESFDLMPNASSVKHLPPELWLKIFQAVLYDSGPLPFLCRAAKVCRLWRELSCHPSLWSKVDLTFGWIKSTDDTLQWLAQHRLSQCREINLSGWKNATNSGLNELSEQCQDLEVVNLSHCAKLTSSAIVSLVTKCTKLRDLDLSFMSADAVSTHTLKLVAEKLGNSLVSLVLAGNILKGFNLVLNAIMENCPCLETLDLSNSRFSTDYLILNVEKLQVSCPAFKILRLANCRVRANQVSQKVQAEAPGFQALQQLSCAMPPGDSPTIGSGIPDDVLKRLLHNTAKLQLLDLRGCTTFHPCTILESPTPDLEQLYLSQSSISRYSDTLYSVISKWKQSLRILDLAWTSPQADHLDGALKALGETAACPLEHLNLAGTTVTLSSVRYVLENLTSLKFLDLTSCRALPRGVKCIHEGRRALDKLKKTLQQLNNASEDLLMDD